MPFSLYLCFTTENLHFCTVIHFCNFPVKELSNCFTIYLIYFGSRYLIAKGGVDYPEWGWIILIACPLFKKWPLWFLRRDGWRDVFFPLQAFYSFWLKVERCYFEGEGSESCTTIILIASYTMVDHFAGNQFRFSLLDRIFCCCKKPLIINSLAHQQLSRKGFTDFCCDNKVAKEKVFQEAIKGLLILDSATPHYIWKF